MKAVATFPSVEASLLDENVSQMFWHYTQALGGVRVVVHEDDWQVAAELHGDYMESLRTGPHPVEPVRAWPLVVLASLFMGLPLWMFGRRKNGSKPS